MSESKPYKKRFGDRRDARWLRDIDSYHKVFPYVLPRRCDAEAYFTESIDVTNLMKYLEEKKADPSQPHITFFHAVLAAVSKTIYFRPALNRFIINKRFYERDNISLSFVAKKTYADHSGEAIISLDVDYNDTLFSISERTNEQVRALRQSGSNSLDELIALFMKLPRFILKGVFALIRFLENHDWTPTVLKEGDSNYSTVLLSHLGSIKCHSIYHHLNEYGTNSIVITVGTIKKEVVTNEDGTTSERDICDFGITLDERIADGFYYAKSIAMLKSYLANPEMLEVSISTPTKRNRRSFHTE